jgi:hypothetical protein
MLVTASAADDYAGRMFVFVAGRSGAYRATASPPAAETDETDALTRALEEAEFELAEYRDANLVSVIGRDAFAAGLGERAARVDEARRMLVEAERAVPWERDVDPEAAWAAAGTDGRRALLDGLVESIVVLPTGRGSRDVARRLRTVLRPEVRGVELSTEHEVGA